MACKTLEGLVAAGFAFEAIITKPRAEKHKGSVPVLDFAKAHHLPFFTPVNKTELSELFRSHRFKSPAGLVVDYGIIISQDVIASFPKGIVNSHFSLLPQWRGADPITFSVLSGQRETGVSLMVINEKLDEGELIAQQKLSISSDTTTPTLTDQLIILSNSMIASYLPRYISGDINTYTQSVTTPPTYSRKLTKEDGLLLVSKPAEQLEREIRAFQGWPKSRITLLEKYDVIVLKARVAQGPTDGSLVIPCANNTYLEITELTAPSGKKMSGQDFLRGYKK
ncbi:MAG TPA: methionyl-tRNA formyltransferase [Candidatus Saccharimonadales bacterium]|nr:methionyl-tRNA formyltransferase [Candidatus Saccharimonadales bacterium]